MLYQDVDDGDPVPLSDQSLIQETAISLYPLTSEFRESGVATASVEFEGARTGETEIDGSLNLPIPTDLTAAQWAELLADEPVRDTVQVNETRVTLVLADRSWDVTCAAVGAEGVPDSDLPDERNGGVGVGGVSEYSEAYPTETLASANGKWTGITCTDRIYLENGDPASKPDGDDLEGDVIRIAFSLNGSDGGTYTVDARLARTADGSWNTKTVYIYDDSGNSDDAELKSSPAAAIYGDGRTDLLDTANYDGPSTGSGSFSDFVSRIQELDEPVTWQTARMVGRVDVTLECDTPPPPPDEGVETVDGSTPDSERSSLLFDVQVAADTTRTVTDFNVTTPGNQNDDASDVDSIKRPSDPEVELTPSNDDGVNQTGTASGGRFRTDGTNYTLDTAAVFSDGAVLSVEMGDLQDGGDEARLTYDVADSASDADVIVTFYFEDGTRHRTFLRVTNVDS